MVNPLQQILNKSKSPNKVPFYWHKLLLERTFTLFQRLAISGGFLYKIWNWKMKYKIWDPVQRSILLTWSFFEIDLLPVCIWDHKIENSKTFVLYRTPLLSEQDRFFLTEWFSGKIFTHISKKSRRITGFLRDTTKTLKLNKIIKVW